MATIKFRPEDFASRFGIAMPVPVPRWDIHNDSRKMFLNFDAGAQL